MVLNATAEFWVDEIQSAEQYRSSLLEGYQERVEGYVGPFWRNADSERLLNPENHAHELVSLLAPQLVFGNPRTRIASTRQGEHQAVAKALEFGVNRWVKQSRMRRLNEKLAVDYLFNWCVARITREPVPGTSREFDDPPKWPSLVRVAPDEFLCDYHARSPENWEWAGHRCRMLKSDLLAMADEEEGWIREEVQKLAEDDFAAEDHDVLYEMTQPRDMPKRGYVEYYEIWCPHWDPDALEGHERALIPHDEEPLDEGDEHLFNGWLFYVAMAKDDAGSKYSAFIRKAQRFFGPRTGPYRMGGAYVVPDSVAPLSPVTATEAQAEFLNKHTLAAGDAADRYKKLVVVNSSERRLQQAVASMENHGVLPLDGFERGQVEEVELGGLTPQHLAILDWARNTLDRNSGIHEAMRGNVTGAATATENEIAASSSSTRVGFLIQKFRDFVAGMLEDVAWYLYHDDEVEFALGEEAQGKFFRVVQTPMGPVRMPIQEAAFRGGASGEEGGSFDDLDLEIEPYSMERTTHGLQQLRFQQLLEFVLGAGQAMPMMPHVQWKPILDMAGEFMNQPDLGSYFDLDAARQLGQQMQEAGAGAPLGQGGPGGGQPRLGRDTGGARSAPGSRPFAGGSRPGSGPGAPLGQLAGNAAGAGVKQGAA